MNFKSALTSFKLTIRPRKGNCSFMKELELPPNAKGNRATAAHPKRRVVMGAAQLWFVTCSLRTMIGTHFLNLHISSFPAAFLWTVAFGVCMSFNYPFYRKLFRHVGHKELHFHVSHYCQMSSSWQEEKMLFSIEVPSLWNALARGVGVMAPTFPSCCHLSSIPAYFSLLCSLLFLWLLCCPKVFYCKGFSMFSTMGMVGRLKGNLYMA